MFVFIQINTFDDNFELERAKKKVRGVVDEIASHANLPHYKIVGNIDGVALKKKFRDARSNPYFVCRSFCQ